MPCVRRWEPAQLVSSKSNALMRRLPLNGSSKWSNRGIITKETTPHVWSLVLWTTHGSRLGSRHGGMAWRQRRRQGGSAGCYHEATLGRSPISRKASRGYAPPAPIERGSGRAVQADEGLLDARALDQDLAGVLGFWIIGSARVSLQRGLGLAEPAQVFAQDLHIRNALLAPLTLRHTWIRNNGAMRATLGTPAVSLQ